MTDVSVFRLLDNDIEHLVTALDVEVGQRMGSQLTEITAQLTATTALLRAIEALLTDIKALLVEKKASRKKKSLLARKVAASEFCLRPDVCVVDLERMG